MSVQSDPAFVALHVVRVRGVTGTAEIAATTGLADDAVEDAMRAHQANDFVTLRTG
ncbi:MAG: hypothetical protein QOG90_1320, partial [Actinomycetota bacterium]